MPQNASEIKERIISFLERNGPSLPVHIAQNVSQSILFTSAFLSELLSDKRLKISTMRVGSSAVHFIPGQEPQLEKFSNYLKSKEKEAYILLKEKEILKDSEIEPAIRVALRSIKDFAVPFEKNGEVYWRYFTTEERENKPISQKEEKSEIPKVPTPEETKKENSNLEIFDSETEEPGKDIKPKIKVPKKSTTKTARKSKPSENARNKFFNKVKDFLSEKNIEILGIEEIAINKIIFRVKEDEKPEEYLIVAYNKKRIAEEDILKAYKKAEELELPYKIISLGDPLKKIENIVNAAKTLKSIEKIE